MAEQNGADGRGHGGASGEAGSRGGCGRRSFRRLSRRLLEFERELAVGADQLVVTLVGLHDFLDQAVAHHIAVVKLNEADALYVAQDVDHFNESAAMAEG